MSSQAKKDALVAQFRSVTGASQVDAVKLMKKNGYRVDVAVDAYFESGAQLPVTENLSTSSTLNIDRFFDQYKDSSTEIGIDGTIRLCQDLEIEPEDVVTLALAYEFGSPAMGEWPKKRFVEGMQALRCDSISTLKAKLPELRKRLESEPEYFGKVYLYAFNLGLVQGQRSLPTEVAVGFWQLLLPLGLAGGALRPVGSPPGWKEEYTQWWFQFIEQRAVKGISKDTWNMFLDFVSTSEEKFGNHDTEGSWPSLIDDFVAFAQARIVKAS